MSPGLHAYAAEQPKNNRAAMAGNRRPHSVILFSGFLIESRTLGARGSYLSWLICQIIRTSMIAIYGRYDRLPFGQNSRMKTVDQIRHSFTFAHDNGSVHRVPSAQLGSPRDRCKIPYMFKKDYVLAVVSFLLIPAVVVAGGMLINFINPEIAAS